MKRSEFDEIVNAVAQKEAENLNAEIQNAKNDAENPFAEIVARIAVSIPDIAARTTADILIRAGLISFESDS